MGLFQRSQDLIEIAACLVGRKAAEAVVAAEFNDDDVGVHGQDGIQIGNGVFGRGAAGSLIVDLVVVAEVVEIALQHVGKSLPWVETETGGDAVAEANQERPVCGGCRQGKDQNEQRND